MCEEIIPILWDLLKVFNWPSKSVCVLACITTKFCVCGLRAAGNVRGLVVIVCVWLVDDCANELSLNIFISERKIDTFETGSFKKIEAKSFIEIRCKSLECVVLLERHLFEDSTSGCTESSCCDSHCVSVCVEGSCQCLLVVRDTREYWWLSKGLSDFHTSVYVMSGDGC